ncbi:hypothetical protein P691DRAFT_96317 [Macrolepiota fuliginosa MF-IS2]|uniref:Uncharacterized protein n=1 Tax=Macrolepiota fuliginosa MF-IS2 TaxID=1400762 RepID=A0A9P6C9G9_9AGAR|nr:hypothetical protein P691DRAFT_96317 [Macrolepiota fuliginosa MF-IS2]
MLTLANLFSSVIVLRSGTLTKHLISSSLPRSPQERHPTPTWASYYLPRTRTQVTRFNFHDSDTQMTPDSPRAISSQR